jgi:hypothetical protein
LRSFRFHCGLLAVQRRAHKEGIMTTSEKAWGVGLSGRVFDLEDWRDTLKEPFDPWVLHEGDDFILCAL